MSNTTVIIPLGHGHEALIDAADFEMVSAHNWTRVKVRPNHSTEYAKAKIDGKDVYLHRFLTGAGAGELVDHENGNGLDCRRQNIRVATRTQNGGNMRVRPGSRSGFKGVSWHALTGKWCARCRKMYLGLFDAPESAADAYDAAARETFGQFAKLNNAPIISACRFNITTKLAA